MEAQVDQIWRGGVWKPVKKLWSDRKLENSECALPVSPINTSSRDGEGHSVHINKLMFHRYLSVWVWDKGDTHAHTHSHTYDIDGSIQSHQAADLLTFAIVSAGHRI